MAEFMAGFALLKASYHLVIFGIQLEQVPDAVRRSLELVRTCHDDLQYLIELRNQNLALLEREPVGLARLNKIIQNAHQGLFEVCNIVEALYRKHVMTVEQVGGISIDEFAALNKALHRLERFWTDQILYRL